MDDRRTVDLATSDSAVKELACYLYHWAVERPERILDGRLLEDTGSSSRDLVATLLADVRLSPVAWRIQWEEAALPLPPRQA
jgi:hypothetical protein